MSIFQEMAELKVLSDSILKKREVSSKEIEKEVELLTKRLNIKNNIPTYLGDENEDN